MTKKEIIKMIHTEAIKADKESMRYGKLVDDSTDEIHKAHYRTLWRVETEKSNMLLDMIDRMEN